MTLNNLIFLPIKREVLEKKNYLLLSSAFHLLIIILFYYGLPNLFRYRSEFLPPLPIEIINISDKTVAPKINFKSNSPDKTKNKANYSDQENIKYDNQTETVDNQDVLEIEKTDKQIIKKKSLN